MDDLQSQYRVEFSARYHLYPEFAKFARDDPKLALRRIGINVPRNMEVKLVEDDDEHVNIPMPHSPDAFCFEPPPKEVVYRFRSDKKFASDMATDMNSALKEGGLELEIETKSGTKPRIIEDTPKVAHFRILAKSLFVSGEDMKRIAEQGEFVDGEVFQKPGIICPPVIMFVRKYFFLDKFNVQITHSSEMFNLTLTVGIDRFGKAFFETDDDALSAKDYKMIARFFDGDTISLKGQATTSDTTISGNVTIDGRRRGIGRLPDIFPSGTVFFSRSDKIHSQEGRYRRVSVCLSSTGGGVIPDNKIELPPVGGVNQEEVDDSQPHTLNTDDWHYKINGLGYLSIDNLSWTLHKEERIWTANIYNDRTSPPHFDDIEWKREAVDLLEKLVDVMSFARGRRVYCPIWETSLSGNVETHATKPNISLDTPLMPIIERTEDANRLVNCVIEKRHCGFWNDVRRAIYLMLSSQKISDSGLFMKLVAIEIVARSTSTTSTSISLGGLIRNFLAEQTHDLLIGLKGKIYGLTKVRNELARRGVTGATDRELATYTAIAHEVMTRMILGLLGFEGVYCSYIDKKGQLDGDGARELKDGKVTVVDPINFGVQGISFRSNAVRFRLKLNDPVERGLPTSCVSQKPD